MYLFARLLYAVACSTAETWTNCSPTQRVWRVDEVIMHWNIELGEDHFIQPLLTRGHNDYPLWVF